MTSYSSFLIVRVFRGVKRISGKGKAIPRDGVLMFFRGRFISNGSLFANDKFGAFAARERISPVWIRKEKRGHTLRKGNRVL